MPLQTAGNSGSVQHIILREGVNVFRAVLERMERKVTSSCIKHITIDTYPMFEKQLRIKPLFSRYYLVYANVDKGDSKYFDFLNSLALCGWVRLILTVRNRAAFDELCCHKYFSSFKILDCYNVTIKVMDAYIRDELLRNGCDPRYVTATAVTRIRRRAKYKAYVLDSVIPLLATTNLSKSTVESYISAYTGVTLQNIGAQFFVKKRQPAVAGFLMRYRRNISNIYKQVLNYLDAWFEMYDEYISGRLCDETILVWLENSGSKFGVTQEYQARKWLQSFSSISYDFMIFAFIELQGSASSSNNRQLLALYKIFRMVESL